MANANTKSAAIHKLRETRGQPRSESANVAQAKMICPAFLSRAAKNEWKRVMPELQAAGILSNLDKATLVAYCIAYGEMKILTEEIERKQADPEDFDLYNGRTRHHLFTSRDSVMKQIATLSKLLGMTPTTREAASVIKRTAPGAGGFGDL